MTPTTPEKRSFLMQSTLVEPPLIVTEPLAPRPKEVDAALKYILGKTKPDITSSPKRVISEPTEKSDQESPRITQYHSPSQMDENVVSRNILSSDVIADFPSTTTVQDYPRNPNNSPAQVMGDWIRLSFSSQVFFKDTSSSESMTIEEDS